jgi:hypothetical protein
MKFTSDCCTCKKCVIDGFESRTMILRLWAPIPALTHSLLTLEHLANCRKTNFSMDF